MDITWDPSSVVSITDLCGSPQVGVEPICLLLHSTFEEYCLAWLHLLTLTKLWWRRLESNQQCREAEDLQSSGVTSFPTSPNSFYYIGTHYLDFYCKHCYLTHQKAVCSYMVGPGRFELPTNGLKVHCSTNWATIPWFGPSTQIRTVTSRIKSPVCYRNILKG